MVTEVPRSIAPGFSVPSRAPPPGFSSHLRPRRVDQAFDSSGWLVLMMFCEFSFQDLF